MLVMNCINPSEIESSLGAEKSKPIVDAFNHIAEVLKENQDILDNQQKQIDIQQESFDKQQRILDDQKAVIHEIKENFEEYKNGDLDRKTEIKKDLLIELATKADIEKMNGKIGVLQQEMQGEFKSIKLWMKMLLALALLTIACFSPTAQVLIKLFNF
jgi:peptidoglycan hydrolase CwlO-like protein